MGRTYNVRPATTRSGGGSGHSGDAVLLENAIDPIGPASENIVQPPDQQRVTRRDPQRDPEGEWNRGPVAGRLDWSHPQLDRLARAEVPREGHPDDRQIDCSLGNRLHQTRWRIRICVVPVDAEPGDVPHDMAAG